MTLFKKQKQHVIDLMRDKEVVYRVTLSAEFVQFESASRDWLVRYSTATFEAGLVNYLVANRCLDELTEIVRVQYLTGWLLRDAKLVKEFYKGIARAQNRAQAAQKSAQSDAEILAEEKVKSEQTAESIMELEAIKKGGK